MRSHLAVVLTLLSLTGCFSDQGACFSCIRSAMLVEPADLSTNQATLRVWADPSALQGDDASRFMNGISLVTWPEGVPVAGAVHRSTDGGGNFSFVPTVPLELRWYALRLDISELSQRYSTVSPGEDPDAALGLIEHRFLPAEQPLLLLSMAGTPERSILRVGGTEPLRTSLDAAGVGALVSVSSMDGADVVCAPSADPEPVANLAIYGYFFMQCAHVELTQPLTVHVAPGLQSAGGHPLRDGTGATDMRVTWTPSQSAQAPLPVSFFDLPPP
jgi:hypothetical protein